MSYLRFNHVFFALMMLALVSGFILKPHVSDRARAQVQNIFAPVARPANKLGGWAHTKLVGDSLRDDGSPKHPRTSAELLIENQQLRIELANLRGRAERLLETQADRAKLGDVAGLCSPFSVIGGDSGPRDSLLLGGSSFDRLLLATPVLYTGGIAGRISRVGVGGAQVLLVTDRQSKLTAAFARFVKKPDGAPDFQRLAADAVLVEGAGGGALMVRNLAEAKIKEVGLRLDDWLVLSDRDWPLALDGYRIGRVVAIVPSRAPGFADLRIVPDQNLMALREVMVMNRSN